MKSSRQVLVLAALLAGLGVYLAWRFVPGASEPPAQPSLRSAAVETGASPSSPALVGAESSETRSAEARPTSARERQQHTIEADDDRLVIVFADGVPVRDHQYWHPRRAASIERTSRSGATSLRASDSWQDYWLAGIGPWPLRLAAAKRDGTRLVLPDLPVVAGTLRVAGSLPRAPIPIRLSGGAPAPPWSVEAVELEGVPVEEYKASPYEDGLPNACRTDDGGSFRFLCPPGWCGKVEVGGPVEFAAADVDSARTSICAPAANLYYDLWQEFLLSGRLHSEFLPESIHYAVHYAGGDCEAGDGGLASDGEFLIPIRDDVAVEDVVLSGSFPRPKDAREIALLALTVASPLAGNEGLEEWRRSRDVSSIFAFVTTPASEPDWPRVAPLVVEPGREVEVLVRDEQGRPIKEVQLLDGTSGVDWGATDERGSKILELPAHVSKLLLFRSGYRSLELSLLAATASSGRLSLQATMRMSCSARIEVACLDWRPLDINISGSLRLVMRGRAPLFVSEYDVLRRACSALPNPPGIGVRVRTDASGLEELTASLFLMDGSAGLGNLIDCDRDVELSVTDTEGTVLYGPKWTRLGALTDGSVKLRIACRNCVVRVVDEAGKPVANAFVQPHWGPDTLYFGGSGTGSDGAYRLVVPSLPSSCWILTGGDSFLPKLVDWPRDQLELDVVLPTPVRLTLIVRRGNGSPAVGAYVQAVEATGWHGVSKSGEVRVTAPRGIQSVLIRDKGVDHRLPVQPIELPQQLFLP